MQTIMTSSIKGGEGKTSVAVGLAMTACELGMKVLFIDLDPSADATKWLDMEPGEDDFHVGDILGARGSQTKNPEKDPTGWAMQMAKVSGWHDSLYVISSHESLGALELSNDPTMELRLKKSLVGSDFDVVIVDCPNRSGGPLLRSALLVADTIVYSAVGDDGGLEGVYGAQRALNTFKEEQLIRGLPAEIEEVGTVFCGYQATATPRVTKLVVDELRDAGLLLTPLVPARTAVRESRVSRRWVSNWGKSGEDVINAYKELGKKIFK
ncbi:ParA family protein [Glutamicibacter ardleyensis]|uniref:ParA family protein n=1 Tax=Glutamicibacter ardleyensis TaxID=225894 RepID=UPI003FD52C0E